MAERIIPLDIGPYRGIVILTGAGISVASGLRPYRGPGGIWEEGGAGRLAFAHSVDEDSAAAWDLFGPLRGAARAAQPNAAHTVIAELERRCAPPRRVTVITQNIDGLHQRAGSVDVVELHGSVFRTRCHNAKCDLAPFEDDAAHTGEAPRCPRCSAPLRPDVVLFNEPIPVDAEWRSKRALRDCDLFIAVGTSGTVSPASNFVRSAEYAGARTILVNLEPMSPRNPAFQEEVLGRAEEVLPALLRQP
jgi:NAD-dependent deacetylase